MYLPQKDDRDKQHLHVADYLCSVLCLTRRNRPAAPTVAALSGHAALLGSEVSEEKLAIEAAQLGKMTTEHGASILDGGGDGLFLMTANGRKQTKANGIPHVMSLSGNACKFAKF